jgi:hypothetical protein
MKPIKWITVQPNIGNDVRQKVRDWCDTTFNHHDNESSNWFMTSNYTRGHDASFDMLFKEFKHAEWFILRWGGVISSIEYEDVPEQYVVSKHVLDTLFE